MFETEREPNTHEAWQAPKQTDSGETRTFEAKSGASEVEAQQLEDAIEAEEMRLSLAIQMAQADLEQADPEDRPDIEEYIGKLRNKLLQPLEGTDETQAERTARANLEIKRQEAREREATKKLLDNQQEAI